MSVSVQRKVAFVVVVCAAFVVVGASGSLIADYVAALRGAAAQARRIERLKARGLEDVSVEATLAAEWEWITSRSLERDDRRRRLGWVIVVSAVVLLIAAGRFRALGPATLPPEAVTVAARSARLGRDLGGGGIRAERQRSSFGPVDLRGDVSDAIDPAVVDGIIDRCGRGKDAAIAIVQAIQERFRFLPDEALRHVCARTEITPAQICGVSTFYSQFRRSPVGRHIVKVCHGTACHVAGAEMITEELRRRLGIVEGEDTDPGRAFTIDRVACIGCCSLAPAMMIDGVTAGGLTPATACAALEARREVAIA